MSRFLFLLLTLFAVEAFAARPTPPPLLQYIMDEVEPEAAGFITLPKYSESGEYELSWGLDEAADSYVLEKYTADIGQTQWQSVYTGNATSLAIEETNNGRYKYRIQGCIGGVCGLYLESDYIHVDIPPAAPANVVAIQSGDQNIITWNAVTLSASTGTSAAKPAGETSLASTTNEVTSADAVVYYLEQSVNGNDYQVIEQTTATGYSHTAKANEASRYRVSACDPVSRVCTGASTPSNIVGGLAGTDNLAGSFANNQVSLSWNPVPGAVYYLLEVQINGGQWTELDLAYQNYYRYDDIGEGSYTFRIRPCDSEACYEASQQNYSIGVAESGQCRLLENRLEGYIGSSAYYLRSPDPTPDVEMMPGMLRSNLTKGGGLLMIASVTESEARMGHWQISPAASPGSGWTLQLLSGNEFKQAAPTRGGLYMTCRQENATTARLTFVNAGASDSFTVSAGILSDDTLQLQLLAEQADNTLVHKDGDNNLYLELPARHGNKRLKITQVNGVWQSEVLSLGDSSWLDLVAALEVTDYQINFADYDDDSREDMRMTSAELSNIYIFNAIDGYNVLPTVTINTQLLGVPVTN